jgi:protein NrfC
MAFPLAEGYILVDSKKCQGCQSCMMACSLVHHGEANLSLARIQVMQNILKNWPDDIRIAQCRQCANPLCVKACPTGALYVDTTHGNIRVIDEAKCDGCRLCIDACPYRPQRIIWNPATGKAIKCDLCLDTPYWDEAGGPDGKQICVAICPQQAIRFTREVPDQRGDVGYDINLREPVSR